jgi:hypothetical protein
MSVGYAFGAESHTGITGSTNEASFTWNLDTTGARAAVVHVVTVAAAPLDTGVTIGGQAMALVAGAEASDTATEPGTVRSYFLDNIPQGAAVAVVVSRTNNATVMYAVAQSLTAAGETEPFGVITQEENGALAEVAVDDGSPGTNSMRVCACHSGLAGIPGAGANTSDNLGIDFGGNVAAAARETVAGQGSRSVGFSNGTSDDRAAVYFAVREKVGGAAQSITGAGGIASGEAFGSASITAGAVSISSGGITSLEAFGSSAITSGGLVLISGSITSEEAFGSASLSVSAVSASPGGIASSEAFGSATLAEAAGGNFSVVSPDGTWLWLNGPHVVDHAGPRGNKRLYGGVRNQAAVVGTNGDVFAAQIDLDTGEKIEFTLEAAFQIDDHTNPGIVVRPDGHIVYFYTGHAPRSPVWYRVSTLPHTIAGGFEPRQSATGVDADKSYADVWHFSGVGHPTHGRFVVAFRAPRPGDPEGLDRGFVYSDDNMQTWSQEYLFFGAEDTRPYAQYVGDGVSKLHCALSGDHPGEAVAGTCHIYHLVIDVAAETVELTNGTVHRTWADLLVNGTIEPADITPVWLASESGGTHGNAWAESIALTATGDPVITFSATDDTPTFHNQNWYARYNGVTWTKTMLTDDQRGISGGPTAGFSNYTGCATADANDPDVVWICTELDDVQWEVYRWETSDGGLTFSSKQAITTNSGTKNIRPRAPVNRIGLEAALWCRGKQGAVDGGYTDLDTFDMLIAHHPAMVIAPLPVVLVDPALSGSPVIGGTLTVSDGTWLVNGINDADSFARQWQLDTGSGFADIPGETGSTITVPNNAAAAIRARITATNEHGSAIAYSDSMTITAPSNMLYDAILALLPVRYMRQNEAVTPIEDYGSANQNPTDLGDPLYGEPGGVPSSAETAIAYDVDDAARIAAGAVCVSNTPTNTPVDFTIIVVAYIDPAAPGGGWFWTEGYSGATAELFGFNHTAGGTIQAQFRNGNSQNGTLAPASANYKGQWLFLMFRHDAAANGGLGEVSLWNKEVKLDSEPSSTHAAVGINGSRTNQFTTNGLFRTTHGSFSIVKLQHGASFNRALTDAEWLSLVDAFNGIESGVDLLPTSIASTEAIGNNQISPQAVQISGAGGISSAETFGTSALQLDPREVSLSGIPSAESVPSPNLGAFNLIGVSGIASQEAFGSTNVQAGVRLVQAIAIPSQEAFGTALTIFTVTSIGIPSAEAFGVPIIGVPPIDNETLLTVRFVVKNEAIQRVVFNDAPQVVVFADDPYALSITEPAETQLSVLEAQDKVVFVESTYAMRVTDPPEVQLDVFEALDRVEFKDNA